MSPPCPDLVGMQRAPRVRCSWPDSFQGGEVGARAIWGNCFCSPTAAGQPGPFGAPYLGAVPQGHALPRCWVSSYRTPQGTRPLALLSTTARVDDRVRSSGPRNLEQGSEGGSWWEGPGGRVNFGVAGLREGSGGGCRMQTHGMVATPGLRGRRDRSHCPHLVPLWEQDQCWLHPA